MKRAFFLVLLIVSIYLTRSFTASVYAHEAYVLPTADFQKGLQSYTSNPLAPLFDPKYIFPCAVITVFLFVAYALNFIWASTKTAEKSDLGLKKFKNWGFLAVRLALAASFLYGALGNSIFGPELSLTHVHEGQIIIWGKAVLGILFALGLFTRLAAVLGILLYLFMFFQVGPYIFTYLNYLGELIALAIFGSRFLALDSLLFKASDRLKKRHEWEVPIVRIFFGTALIYTAVSVKFLHQGIPVEVVNLYGLQRFFPGSPEFISAGAGLSELAIGFLILIGFGQRLTILILFVFLTLSLLFFKEAVWPHLMLYGIGILIFINSGDKLTMDRYFISKLRILTNKLLKDGK